MSNKDIIDKGIDEAFWKNKPASATDCTGLFQGLPVDHEGIESYVDMYDIPDQGSLPDLEAID